MWKKRKKEKSEDGFTGIVKKIKWPRFPNAIGSACATLGATAAVSAICYLLSLGIEKLVLR